MHHGKANAMDAALCDGIMKRLEQLRTSDAQAVVDRPGQHLLHRGLDAVSWPLASATFASDYPFDTPQQGAPDPRLTSMRDRGSGIPESRFS